MIHKRVACVVVLVLALAGCGGIGGLADLGGDVTAEETETQGVIVEGVPALVVNHFLGTIKVSDGEPGKVTANLTKQSRMTDEAEAQAQLDEIVMAFTQSGTDVTLDIEGPSGVGVPSSAPSADLELLVPPGTSLDLELGAGEISLEQPSGDVTVDGGGGKITVTLPADASFRLVIEGGLAEVNSEFEGVPAGGVATDIDVTIGDSPTQTLTFNVGAGSINLKKVQ